VFKRYYAATAGLLCAAVLAAGCGSSSNSSTTSTSAASATTTTSTSAATTTSAASSSLPAGVVLASGQGAPYLPGPGVGKGVGPMVGTAEGTQATAWGTAAGKALGTVSNPPHPTVGYLDILGGIESADRAANSVRQALKAVGYKMLYCDGAGDPTKWVTCGNSLLAQGAKAILLTGIDPSSIPSVVSSAKAKNVPILDCCGLVGPGFNTALYPNEPLSGQILAKALIAKLGSSGGPIAVANYPAPWATARTAQLSTSIKGTSVKAVATSTTDPTNLVQGTQKWVSDTLTANPNLKAFWFAFDSAGQAGGQVVESKAQSGSAPDVFTFHADPSTQVLMRKGAITEVVDVNYDVTAWEVVNALVEFEARHTPLPGYSDSTSYPGIGNPLSYQIVTKSNLPPVGQYVAPQKDGVSYFLAKWKAEGLGS
jgi:ABC-type sugar transport system substrate-binding protein